MGLIFAGELSDSCYYAMVEFPWLEQIGVQDEHHIEFYRRFRDDKLLIVSEDFDGVRFMKKLSGAPVSSM